MSAERMDARALLERTATREGTVMPPTAARVQKASSPGPGLRLWEQVACLLRQRLDDGTLKPGGLVVIGDVLREYGLKTRQTASRALRLLEGEGRLKRFPGYGYMVQASPGQERQGKPTSDALVALERGPAGARYPEGSARKR